MLYAVSPTGVRAQAAQQVPSRAPDSLPISTWTEISAPANLIPFGGGNAVIIRDVVAIQFYPSATASERQRAVALVNGTVIGGSGVGYPEHAYLVRIPYVQLKGDSAAGPVLRAISTLRALTTIEFATIRSIGGVTPMSHLRNFGPARSPDSDAQIVSRPSPLISHAATTSAAHRLRCTAGNGLCACSIACVAADEPLR
jgi:hypothetical protein